MSDEVQKPSRAGTWSDWPVAVILVGVVFALLSVVNGTAPGVLAWGLMLFGVVALLIRRGAFTPRR